MRKGSKSKVLMILAGLLVLASLGCDKEVKLTFVNTTSVDRHLRLTVPGEGTDYIGVVSATGGKLTHKLKIDDDYLPATCSWTGGDRNGQFTVTEDSKGKMMIAIDPTGNIGPIDAAAEVHKTEEGEVKELIVEQQEVVE